MALTHLDPGGDEWESREREMHSLRPAPYALSLIDLLNKIAPNRDPDRPEPVNPSPVDRAPWWMGLP